MSSKRPALTFSASFERYNNVKFLISHIEEVYKETIKGHHYIPEIKKMLALQNGSHDAGVEEKAVEAVIVSRLQDIPPAHLRPLFNDTRRKLKDTDLEETTDYGSHAHKKQRTRDISGVAIAPSPPRRRSLKDADLEESADSANKIPLESLSVHIITILPTRTSSTTIQGYTCHKLKDTHLEETADSGSHAHKKKRTQVILGVAVTPSPPWLRKLKDGDFRDAADVGHLKYHAGK
ncbi:MAG: hypothetical protein J3R72DRAFT_486915 [Linnemannia gamsii]|nr:MAG: hypothetical protein J3R72DRAFT_486915 [Linnemannia gamsii]